MTESEQRYLKKNAAYEGNRRKKVRRTTSDKSNACKIRSRIHQAIFKAYLGQGEDDSNWLCGVFNRQELSHIADIATKAIMHEERINVVLSKQKP